MSLVSVLRRSSPAPTRRGATRVVVALAVVTSALAVAPAASAAGVQTVDELAAALRSGGTVRLEADLTAADAGLSVGSTNTVLDLAGHRLTTTSTGTSAALGISGRGSLTIIDSIGGGKVSARAASGAAVGGAAGTQDLLGDLYLDAVVDASSDSGAAIGGGEGAVFAPFVSVRGGEVTALSRTGAGIGSGQRGEHETVQVRGGTVVATSTAGGAGIGGGQFDSTVDDAQIYGGNVTATAYGDGAAGIGGGGGADGPTRVRISDGASVRATGMSAGIGGGRGATTSGRSGGVAITGAGTIVHASAVPGSGGAGIGALRSSPTVQLAVLDGASVTATGDGAGAGVGADGKVQAADSSSFEVVVSTGATLTARGGSTGSAVGAAPQSTTGRIGVSVGAGAALVVPTDASFRLRSSDTLSVAGRITGGGEVRAPDSAPSALVNNGAIVGMRIESPTDERITNRNFRILYDAAGGEPVASPGRLYARSFDDGGLALASPRRAGYTFAGWTWRKDASSAPASVTSSTDLVTLTGVRGPADLTFVARWRAAPSAVSAVAGDGSAIVSWTPPADAVDSPTVSGYRVTGSPAGACVAAPDESSCAVQGLGNGTEYSFTVTADFSDGKASTSEPSSTVTPIGVWQETPPAQIRAKDAVFTVEDEVSADLGASTPASSSVRWQWQRVPDGLTAWSDVPGATGTTASVVPLSGDGLVPGWFYRLAVTYSKPGYPDATVFSNVVGPSNGVWKETPGARIAATASPFITSGGLTADPGVSTPASSSVRWQWQRVPDGLTAWSDVPGATGTTASVVPLSGDGLVPGWFYRLAVTYAKDGYPDATAYSNVVGPSLGLLDFLVATSPSSTAAAPVRAGDEVTATVSDASVDGIDAAFQWSADGVAIPGATRSTFTPGDDQVGAKLTVAVTGSKDGYLARTVSATAAAVVGAAGRTCAEPFSLVGRVCTVRLDYTGQQGEITLPEDADLVTVDLAGASGGVLKDFPTSLPGRGGRLRGDLRGAAGQRLVYLVGQVGDLTAGTRTVGGGGASASTSSFYTRGGGGTFLASAATDVLLAVAGGGGGVRPNTAGGSGSGSSTAGSAAPVATIGSSCSGEGATATSGGYRPECLTPNNGGTGPAAVEAGVILPGPGGFGGREMNSFTVGGGGGGGYWGGGGGASHAGGGGSGYSGGLSGSIATEASLGGNTGHGYVVLTYTPAVAPDAPTGVRAVAGDGSATVSWTPPAADGGAAVRGYTVTGSPAGSCVTTGATSCVVTGLENGRAHTFTVRASNLRGAGPASAPSAPVTPRVPAAAPVISLQPVGVLAMDGRSASFSVGFTGAPTPSVGWEVSADGGATWAPVSTADGFTISTSTLMSRLSVTAGAVLHRSRYRAVVTNEGGAVTSDAVGLSVSRLLRAPAGFKATPGDGRVRLSWSESVGNKPLPVSGYVVQLLDPSGDETVCLVPASASLSCEVAGLVNARTYSFSVVAVNAAGAGRVATTRGTPFAPVSFTRAPEPVTVRAGEVFTLSAAVAADPVPSLRWEVSADGGRTWRNAGGAVTGTTTSYSEKAQAARSGWRYRVKASQRVGGVSYSGAVVVTITR